MANLTWIIFHSRIPKITNFYGSFKCFSWMPIWRSQNVTDLLEILFKTHSFPKVCLNFWTFLGFWEISSNFASNWYKSFLLNFAHFCTVLLEFSKSCPYVVFQDVTFKNFTTNQLWKKRYFSSQLTNFRIIRKFLMFQTVQKSALELENYDEF